MYRIQGLLQNIGPEDVVTHRCQNLFRGVGHGNRLLWFLMELDYAGRLINLQVTIASGLAGRHPLGGNCDVRLLGEMKAQHLAYIHAVDMI